MNNDFTGQIAAYKAAGCEIVTGVMIPPGFRHVLEPGRAAGVQSESGGHRQGAVVPGLGRGFGRPGCGADHRRLVDAGRPILVLADRRDGAAVGHSSVAASGKPWTARLGFAPAIFEVALDVVTRSEDLTDKAAIMAAIAATDLHTNVGPVNWSGGPMKNVTKTPMAGGQWQRKGDKLELVIVSDKQNPNLPMTGELQVLGQGQRHRRPAVWD